MKRTFAIYNEFDYTKARGDGMPYTIRKRSNKFHVYKKGADGKPEGNSLGGHETRQEAQNQIVAIETSERSKSSQQSTMLRANHKIAQLRHWSQGTAEPPPLPEEPAPVPTPSAARLSQDIYQDRDNQMQQHAPPQTSQNPSFPQEKSSSTQNQNPNVQATEGEKFLADQYGAPFNQAQVNYRQISPDITSRACVNCIFFRGESDWKPCYIVNNHPLNISQMGFCDRHEMVEDSIVEPEPLEVEIVGSAEAKQADYASDEDEDEDQTDKALKALEAIKELFDVAPDSELEVSGFKDLGNGTWLAFWSNNFQDKEGEIFTEKAIDDFIARVDSGQEPYPELWYRHIQPTRHGRAKELFRVGHYAVAVGDYDDVVWTKGFREYYQTHENGLEVSHGYRYPQGALRDGVYHAFNTFEISVLPKGTAANPHTSFSEVKESNMELTDEKKQNLIDILGQDRFDAMIRAAEAQGKAKEADGVNFKQSDMDTEGEEDDGKDKSSDQPSEKKEAADPVYATKEDVQAVQDGLKTLMDFMTDALKIDPASTSERTKVTQQSDPEAYRMAEFLKRMGDGNESVDRKKSLAENILGIDLGGANGR